MPTVTIDNIGDVEFPDSMSPAEIEREAERIHNARNVLSAKIRAKYPTSYQDMSDEELTSRIVAKYPQYADMAVQAGQTANVLAPDGTVRAIPGASLGDAIEAGGKIVYKVAAPNGNVHWIPGEHLSEAINAGGVRVDQPTKQPAVSMELSALERLAAGLMDGPTEGGNNLPSPKAQMAKNTKPSPAVGAVTVGSAAAIPLGMAGEAALGVPGVKEAGTTALKYAVKESLKGAGMFGAYEAIKHLFGDK